MEIGSRRPQVEEQPRESRSKSKVLVLGEFRRDEISVSSGQDFKIRDEVQARKIDDMWRENEAKGYFPGPLVRISSYGLSPDGKLQLGLGKTNFKDYMGTRDGESLHKYGYEGVANPLSTDVVLITSDNKMILGKKISGDAEGSLVTFGGYAHPEKDIDGETGDFDVYKTAEREIEEELGVTRDQIEDEICLGLTYQYGDMSSPVAMFAMRTSLTVEQLKRLKGVDEEGEIIVADPHAIANVTIANAMKEDSTLETIVPDGRVTVALARKWLEGADYDKRVIHEPDQLAEREPRGKVRYVGFDMDGTLMDTMPDNTRIFADYVQEKYGVNAKIAKDHYKQTVGQPTGEQIRSLIGELSEAEAAKVGHAIDKKTEEQVAGRAFPDVEDALQQLKREGYRLFVSSGHQQTAVNRLLERAGLQKYFDICMGVDPEDPGFVKGDAHFRRAAGQFGVPYEKFVQQAVFVGDGTSDIKAAENSYMVGIGRVGTNAKETMEQAGAKAAIDDLSQLPELLPKL